MVLPNFVIAGAAKAGTSSLTAMVSQHPQVFMPTRKEPHYFLHPERPAAYAGPGDDDLNGLVVSRWDDYTAMFDPGGDRQAIGEASVFYLTSPAAMVEMRRRLGDVRVVVTLRNPARRAFSAYSHLRMFGRETLSFHDALQAEDARTEAGWEPLWRYRALGQYADQVDALLGTFGRDTVLLLRYEDFQKDAAGQLRTVFAFLGVDPAFTGTTDVRLLRSGVPRNWALQRLFLGRRGPARRALRRAVPAAVRGRLGRRARAANLRRVTPPADVMAELTAFYGPDVRRLEALTGWDLSSWR